MPVLSVDLAIRSWSDLGVVYLEHHGPQIACEIITMNQWPETAGVHMPPVVELAVRLNTLCLERGASVLMLDGPQSYCADEHADAYSATASATVPPNPPYTCGANINHDRFVGYCLALYEALSRLGWQRLASLNRRSDHASNLETAADLNRESTQRRKIMVESYPNAAWKSLGIAPLPDRQSCRVSHLAHTWTALTAILPLITNRPPNHNQMQALVGGLPGLAIASDLTMAEEKTVRTYGAAIWAPMPSAHPSLAQYAPTPES